MKRVLKITGVAAALFAVLFLALALYFLIVTADVRLDRTRLTMPTANITLYDAFGEEMPAAAAGNSLSRLPAHVGQAFVAVEDKRFYKHHGVDVRRMAGALLHNIGSFSFREGASTISQQLIKNTHLSSEKTIARKLREIRLAARLEKAYSKEEILALYLNSIYFGHSAFGIGNAAHFYFGKEASELTVAESAMLAAVVRSPNRYSPFRDAESCRARRDLVLRLMLDQGYLTREEYERATAEPLPDAPFEVQAQNAYLRLVWDELDALFPEAEKYGTWNVETYYRPDLQEELQKTDCGCDFCALIRDNHEDAIVALAATAGIPLRSPASTIKPLLVYAPALEEGLISPASPVLDAKTDFGGYAPDDYGGASGGYMSVRHALAHSVNIPAVRILNELGVVCGTSYLNRLGIPVDEDDASLALALGGMRTGVRLTQLADGYSVFADGGKYSPSATIRRITREDGSAVYERRQTARNVFSEDVCWLMNDMLQTAVKEGTAKRLRALPFPVCAKTGTAGTEAGNTDAYCISYTADHVAAVWVGNADNAPTDITGGGLPANEVLRILRALYRDGAPSPLFSSERVVRLHYDGELYERDHALYLSDPAAPPFSDPAEYFRAENTLPVSTRFSLPTIRTPKITIDHGSVKIVLCQTEYYDYDVIRENRGKKATIYSGKYRNAIIDNSVTAGETYRYTVIPRYREHSGDPVVLPCVTLPRGEKIPDRWWDQ